MAPHKHSRASPRRPKLEQLKADHELFLQAFEKPTQIYRFLAARHKISPVFLRRTLTYMPNRSKQKSDKQVFSIDSLLERKENKLKSGKRVESVHGKFLTLTFNQLMWKADHTVSDGKANIELILLKVCHKRRKDICLPIMKVTLGQCEVPVNPTAGTLHSSDRSQMLSIPSSYFSQSNGHTVKSYRLLLQVQCPTLSSAPNGSLCNGDTDSESNTDGPASKRRKVLTRSKEREKDSDMGVQQRQLQDVTIFTSELVVVDKQSKCHLTDGSYDLSLQEVRSKTSSKYQSASWETIMDGKTVGPLEVTESGPRLCFNLAWSSTDVDAVQTVPAASPERSPRAVVMHASSPDRTHSMTDPDKNCALSNGDTAVHRKPLTLSTRRSQHMAATASPSKSPSSKNAIASSESVEHVFYQFLYNNNTRQQTEARDNLRCPWCALNCQQLYSLLKHLTTCHSRFNFTYVPHLRSARIDVAINEHYDGSYAGNPQNLITSHMGYAFQRNGPCRRTPVTQILVMKPDRPKESLLEFQEGENKDYLTARPYISGHNRTYYHTHSLQPIRPQEMDEDSEDEIDPDWLQERTRMMIDEFTDVNEGEKELMKLWNNHCMKHNFIADSQIPLACSRFIEEHGATILKEDLYHNFQLHLINLYDFSLLHPQFIVKFMAQLDRLRWRGTNVTKEDGIQGTVDEVHRSLVQHEEREPNEDEYDNAEVNISMDGITPLCESPVKEGAPESPVVVPTKSDSCETLVQDDTTDEAL